MFKKHLRNTGLVITYVFVPTFILVVMILGLTYTTLQVMPVDASQECSNGEILTYFFRTRTRTEVGRTCLGVLPAEGQQVFIQEQGTYTVNSLRWAILPHGNEVTIWLDPKPVKEDEDVKSKP